MFADLLTTEEGPKAAPNWFGLTMPSRAMLESTERIHRLLLSEGWCQSNDNSSPVDAGRAGAARVQAASDFHSARAAERRAL